MIALKMLHLIIGENDMKSDKSVLVIDMPDSCNNCRLFNPYEGCPFGSLGGTEIDKDCPLRPFLLGEELRKFRGTIKDKNTLIGFNMAIAICNKYLGETE